MKICLECEFAERKVMDTPQGPQLGGVCAHKECRDPINGTPLPLNIARTQDHFCGVPGRHYKLRVVEAKPAESNVIQLAT